VVLLSAVPTVLCGQQSSPSQSPAAVLAGALNLLGSTGLPGLSLTGGVGTIAGATQDSGTFTATCGAGGTSTLSLQLSAGSRIESRQITNFIPTGTWTDSQGGVHAMAAHNLYSPSSWFCPGVALEDILSASALTIQFIGNEQKNGTTLSHFTVLVPRTGTTIQDQLLVHLSQVEIYLDPQTLRPASIDFNDHPDNDSSTDIHIEIRFDQYTNVNGVWTPFSVQKYINSTLALSLQLQSANIAAAAAAVN
jgi:hypothetical protein